MKESKKSFQKFLLVSVALWIALLIGIFTDGALQLAEARTITVGGIEYTTVPKDCLASDSNGNNKGLYAVYSDGTIMSAEGPIDHGPRTAGGSAPCYYQDQLGLWAGKWGIWGIFDETLTGYVYAPTTGTYKFLLSADDQAWLTFNGSPLITTPYNGQAIASIDLVGGTWYPIQIIYQNRSGSNWFSFWWNIPDNPQPILTKVGIYYQHDITSSGQPGYPTTDTPVTVRAIIWAKDSPNGVEKAYSDQKIEATDLKDWYAAGTDGPDAVFKPVPTLKDKIANDKVYEWPSTWPQIDFEWKVLFNQANSKNTTGYNKNYEYKEYSNLFWSGGWGYDNTLPRGTWRFKVKAILNKGTPVESQDKEYATRISVLDSTAPNDPYGGNEDYIKWLTAYLEVPYEWGGEWFGGKEGQNVGGAYTYDDYGIDCSGLVSNGVNRTGFNWDPWRAYTFTLKYGPDWKIGTADDNYYSQEINKSNIAVGHILNRVKQIHKKKTYGGHVATVWAIRDGGKKGKIVDVIEAAGDPDNKVKINKGRPLESYYLNQYYELRELNRK